MRAPVEQDMTLRSSKRAPARVTLTNNSIPGTAPGKLTADR